MTLAIPPDSSTREFTIPIGIQISVGGQTKTYDLAVKTNRPAHPSGREPEISAAQLDKIKAIVIATLFSYGIHKDKNFNGDFSLIIKDIKFIKGASRNLIQKGADQFDAETVSIHPDMIRDLNQITAGENLWPSKQGPRTISDTISATNRLIFGRACHISATDSIYHPDAILTFPDSHSNIHSPEETPNPSHTEMEDRDDIFTFADSPPAHEEPRPFRTTADDSLSGHGHGSGHGHDRAGKSHLFDRDEQGLPSEFPPQSQKDKARNPNPSHTEMEDRDDIFTLADPPPAHEEPRPFRTTADDSLSGHGHGSGHGHDRAGKSHLFDRDEQSQKDKARNPNPSHTEMGDRDVILTLVDPPPDHKDPWPFGTTANDSLNEPRRDRAAKTHLSDGDKQGLPSEFPPQSQKDEVRNPNPSHTEIGNRDVILTLASPPTDREDFWPFRTTADDSFEDKRGFTSEPPPQNQEDEILTFREPALVPHKEEGGLNETSSSTHTGQSIPLVDPPRRSPQEQEQLLQSRGVIPWRNIQIDPPPDKARFQLAHPDNEILAGLTTKHFYPEGRHHLNVERRPRAIRVYSDIYNLAKRRFEVIREAIRQEKLEKMNEADKEFWMELKRKIRDDAIAKPEEGDPKEINTAVLVNLIFRTFELPALPDEQASTPLRKAVRTR